MAIVTVPPTRLDIAVAKTIAAHTEPRIERTAQLLTWGADEHILCALAAGWWLFCRSKGAAKRHASDHILVTTLVASALPHILKAVFDQERPDRTTIRAIGAVSRFRASGLMPSRLGMRYTSGLSLRPPACFRQNKEI